MKKETVDKTTLKKFSVSMFIALCIVGTILWSKRNNNYAWFYGSGILLFLLGLFATNLLRPVYTLWMRLAFVLGWINTRLVLFIAFYLVFTPLGLLMRLFGKDPLDRKIEKKDKKSYWKKKDASKPNLLSYERQF